MTKYFIVLLLLFGLESIAQKDSIQRKPKEINYTYAIITPDSTTYGYDIYADKKLLIHQPSIPGMPGNKGFESRKDAVLVAKLVMEKMQKGIMPPTITKDELEKLKVLH